QVEVVRNLLQYAEHEDRFALIAANSRVHSFAPELLPVTSANVAAAVEFLERSHLVGAMNLGEGLDEAARVLRDATTGNESALAGGRPGSRLNGYVVHVGTGFAALGEKRAAALMERIPSGVHYVGVGVGKEWARSFMKDAAEKTGGYFTQ